MAGGLKVKAIPGEWFRYWVESRSDPEHPHLVDISGCEGWAQCSCKNWSCNAWPAIRDRTEERFSKWSTCSHVRAALKVHLPLSIDLTMRLLRQHVSHEDEKERPFTPQDPH